MHIHTPRSLARTIQTYKHHTPPYTHRHPSTSPVRYINCVEEGEDTPQWEAFDDGHGNTYYYNHSTGESSWERPRGLLLRLRAIAMLTGGTDK